ncbi:MFS transporter [Salsuginibacillus kocurii]|uniref:MFS transporter n=1 Tax=Salsuginibacillus kocurii TaxID=427078 RepID=UPI000363C2B1|nr:glycoside-pentoside-hexuronide (GPH):cation symporter [Salsuginibacillus kocurii]
MKGKGDEQMLVTKQEVPPATEVERPGRREMWAYGVGSFGIFAVWSLMSSFLTYYYTDVVGITAGAVGTLMLLARLFDGVTDLGMGSVVDKTKSKYGKARPWLLWLTIPLGIATVLLFSVPDIGATGAIIYAYVSYIGFVLIYTAVSIPYKTLLGVMTQHQHSRSISNIYAAVFILSGNLLVVAFTQPLAAAIGWSALAFIYGLLIVITLYITFFKVKERAATAAHKTEIEKVPVKIGFQALVKNKFWLIITLYCATFYTTIGLTQGAAMYYAQYIIGNVDYFPLIGIASALPMLIGVFFIKPFVRRWGKRNVAMTGALIFIIGQCIKLADPYSLLLFLSGHVLVGIGLMPAIALTFAMINDTIEYGEWKTGVRTEGLVNSGTSVGIKVGTGIGLALIGWLLGFGGYVGGSPEQSTLALQMILALNLYIPLALGLVKMILLYLFKVDHNYPDILADLQARKVEG